MDNLPTTLTWMPTEIILVGFVVLIIMFSLGFTLWKSLSNTIWPLYWHISSFLTGFGAFSLAIIASRVVTNVVLVGSAFAIVFSGIGTALLGAIIIMVKYLRFNHKS